MTLVHLPESSAIVDAITWFTAPGWTTAHELRRNGLETICSRWLPEERRQPAPDGMRFCGQCRRRQP
jgi:hypothetical protein